MVTLDTQAGFVHALGAARDVAFASYFLPPGPVLHALTDAARHGAAVRVRLDGAPLGHPDGPLHDLNVAAVAKLRAAGVDAALTAPGDAAAHSKAAVVDGTAWLDDRNWAKADLIVRDDDPRDVAALRSAMAGRPGDGPGLATTKAAALRLEAGVIATAGADELDIETESFGSGEIYGALLHRAAAHLPTRLIVAGREAADARNAAERTCLTHLATLGVDVRTGGPRHDLNEKLAVTASAAWAGSANATYAGGAFGAQSDWGLTSRDARVVDGLRDAFERNWSQAHAFVPGTEREVQPIASSAAMMPSDASNAVATGQQCFVR